MTMSLQPVRLDELSFDNRLLRELPADPYTDNSPRQVTGACYSLVSPTPVSAPRLVSYSREVAELIGLAEPECRSSRFTQVFAGNALLAGMEPHAMCYGGHQFGSWAGQLGDGRAINLGEVLSPAHGHQTLQLKGAGPTPYSRFADGLAVLRSSIREFLCSEAMHHLGVPTTRALSLVITGEQVGRDMFYDGHPREEPGAVVCRVAPSFLRFGNFELCTARGEIELLRTLVDFTLRTCFPQLGQPGREAYLNLLAEVCRSTAHLMVEWMRVGFVHGVMNTDNMSILGLTIDYGPYGWLEPYDPGWTPNTTDAQGRRYCYGRQAAIAQWNLLQLANALFPLIGEIEPVREALDEYRRVYEAAWPQMMADKLGLDRLEGANDADLIGELLELLPLVETDMTIFFRRLVEVTEITPDQDADTLLAPLDGAYYAPEQLEGEYRKRMERWLKRYCQRIRSGNPSPERVRRRMLATNPKYVLRNYLAQMAIEQAEQGEYHLIDELLELLRHPYDEQPELAHHAARRPEWARHKPGCSMLSCSS